MSSRLDLPQADTDEAERYRQACATALRLLARREHSTRELAHKLQSRGCPVPVLDRVIAALRDEGALSDRRFADSYTEARVERGFGPLRIEAELRERGVDGALIEAALASHADDWVVSIRRQRRKRFGGQPPRDFTGRARQMRFLQQRGFSGEQIREALTDGADADD